MTIKEIIEKYHCLARQLPLGYDQEVNGIDFSGFEPIKISGEHKFSNNTIQYATDKEYMKKCLDSHLAHGVVVEIYKSGVVRRKRSDVDEDGQVLFTDTLYCLRKKQEDDDETIQSTIEI